MEFGSLLATSEIQALNAQIHPHFVFNALHGISTLVDSDPGQAKAMMLKLSSFLRRTLEHDTSHLISLEEELEFAREYLELEKMRLGEKLAVAWSIDPDAAWVLVPQLILQPLVENAVKHGVSMLQNGGRIEITARRGDQILELRVRNTFAARRTPGTGVGLRNTVARLKYLYCDDATFSFAESDDRTATARIVVPVLGSRQKRQGSIFQSRPAVDGCRYAPTNRAINTAR